MKEMNKKEQFTDKEWEKLASLLSDEKGDSEDLLNRFLADDINNTGEQWKELRNMSDTKEIDVNKAWNRVFSKINEDKPLTVHSFARISIFRNRYMRAAAAILILLCLGTSIIYLSRTDALSKKISFATGNDQKNLLIKLSDGSRIFLNRNSELSYRASFGKTRRNVRLSGEAFFEISPDASKPFIIDAGKAMVKVVGTSFDVISKNEESAVEVFVKTGKVMLSDHTGSKSLVLDPGFVGTIGENASGKILNKNPNYLAWNTGHLVYDGQKLDVVFKDLKRVYNMDIVADDPHLLENTWTSPIDNQPQETIIRLICASFNLAYTKAGNVYHLRNK